MAVGVDAETLEAARMQAEVIGRSSASFMESLRELQEEMSAEMLEACQWPRKSPERKPRDDEPSEVGEHLEALADVADQLARQLRTLASAASRSPQPRESAG